MNEIILKGGPPVHPTLYSKRIHRVPRGVEDGDVVALVTRHGRPCGYGFYHSRSLVAVRVLSFQPEVVPDTDWLRARIRAAVHLRSEVLDLGAVTNAWRLVFAEGDDLSGLVVDRYGDVGVVSLFSLGWYRRWPELKRLLQEETGLDRFVLRVDKTTAVNEGFEAPPEEGGRTVDIEEHGIHYRVDPARGHKSGFFLDQRDNRLAVMGMARGRRVFDGMTYHGGFALAAAKGGAQSVVGMDLDEEAIAAATQNARRNQLDVDFQHGDVFHALRAYAAGPEAERPDLLLVDPPKWAKKRDGLGQALHRYGDLNRLALEAVHPEGIVVTSSCSGLVSEVDFLKVLRGAALDTRRAVRFLRIAGAGPDHPIAANFPEGRYLKCVFMSVGEENSGPGKDPEDISRPPPGGHRRSHGGDGPGGRRDDGRGGGRRGRREDRGGRGPGGGGGRREDRGPRPRGYPG